MSKLNTNYRGYLIRRGTYQGLSCYRVIAPRGFVWNEIAANVATARKWIDRDIYEKQAVQPGKE